MNSPSESSGEPSQPARRRRGPREGEPTVPKSYTVPFPVVLELRRAAKEYGSLGRALQVGSELAIRLRKPPAVAKANRELLVRLTYKLPPRTVRVIEELAQSQYNGDTGRAIAACVKLLKVKKLN